MLNSIVARARETLGTLQTNAQRFRNSDFLDAAMAAGALITVADGEIKREEKMKAITFVQSHDALKIFDPSDVNRRFTQHLEGLDPANKDFDTDIAEITALRAIGKVKKNDEQARMVLRLAIAIGGADGDFDANEKAQAAKIARELNLDPADFDLV